MRANALKKSKSPSPVPDSPEQLIEGDPSHDLRLLYDNFRLSESRLELTANAAEIGLWSLDLDTESFWITNKIRDIFRFPPHEKMTFKKFLALVHPDDLFIIEEGLSRALQEPEIISIEYRILLPDGSIRWINSRGTLYKTANGKTTCINGASADITARKMNEMAIARRMQFETLLTEISATFARMILPEDMSNLIQLALGRFLDYFGGDRCGLIKLDLANRKTLITHAFYGERAEERVPPDADLASMFPWTFDQSGSGRCLFFSDLDELPPEAATDRSSWMAMGVKSALNVPIPFDENTCYLILIQSLTQNISWESDAALRLQIIGDIFTSAIHRKTALDELRNSYDEIASLKEKLQIEADYLRAEVHSAQSHDEIIGQSEAIRRVLSMVELVAPTSATVLVCGETGTGKELIATEIHKHSPRRNKLMVKVNCASLPSSLIESELFGREKGAYTGALTRQIGRFELADGSSLFLDEISELSTELQAKLLRVLQEGEFERLGSPKTIKVDVRIIAATNRNLLQEVQRGRFREDLYYRLNVFPIFVPPLRERLEDVPMLTWEFVRDFNAKMGKRVNRIASSVMNSLQEYHWPGNIRELKNVIEHAMIVSTGGELKVRPPNKSSDDATGRLTLEDMEKNHIEKILRQTNWRIKGDGGAAVILGINPATLYSRMKKLGISPQREKDGMSPHG